MLQEDYRSYFKHKREGHHFMGKERYAAMFTELERESHDDLAAFLIWGEQPNPSVRVYIQREADRQRTVQSAEFQNLVGMIDDSISKVGGIPDSPLQELALKYIVNARRALEEVKDTILAGESFAYFAFLRFFMHIRETEFLLDFYHRSCLAVVAFGQLEK